MTSRVGKLEMLLLEACIKLRETPKTQLDMRLVQRGAIRAYATALVWTSDSEGRPTPAQVRGTEREFMKRAKQAPPF